MSDPQIQEAEEFIGKITELTRQRPGQISLVVQVDGVPVINSFSERPMHLRSVQKLLVGLAYAREVAANPDFATQMVDVAEIDKANPSFPDGGAHDAWKTTLKQEPQVSLERIAKGMMINSSNACTRYLINKLGVDRINSLIGEYGLQIEPLLSDLDEVNAPRHGNAAAITTLLENIATREPAAVKTQLENIAKRRVISTNNGEATGFGKEGSWSPPTPQGHDLNFALSATNQGGKRVTTTLLMNNLDNETAAWLKARATSFMCEMTCNESMQQSCKQSLEQPLPYVSRAAKPAASSESWMDYILNQPSRFISGLINH